MIRSPLAGKLQQYLSDSVEVNGEAVVKGTIFLDRMINHLGKSCLVFEVMLNPEFTAVQWIEFFIQYNFVELVISKLRVFKNLNPKTLTYNNGIEMTCLAQIIMHSITRHSYSSVVKLLKADQFTKELVDIVFGTADHPISYCCVDIIITLLEASPNMTNNYEDKNIPPIVAHMVAKQTEGSNIGNTPIQGIVNALRQASEEPVFGTLNWKGLRCIFVMLVSNWGILHNEMFAADAFSVCMDILFAKRTATVLHLWIYDIISDLLYSEKTERVIEWMNNYHLLDKIIEGFEKQAEQVQSERTEKRKFGYYERIEYVPYLAQLSTKIQDISKTITDFAGMLEQHPTSQTFFEQQVIPRERAISEPLADVNSLRKPFAFGYGNY